MQEILKEIVKKEEEAKLRIEEAQQKAEEIVANAKIQADRIIIEARLTAKKISEESKRKAEQQIKQHQGEILVREKNKIKQLEAHWQDKLVSSASKILQGIVDIRYLTGKFI